MPTPPAGFLNGARITACCSTGLSTPRMMGARRICSVFSTSARVLAARSAAAPTAVGTCSSSSGTST